MRRWSLRIFVSVIVIVIIAGGIFLAVLPYFSSEQQEVLVPIAVAITIITLLANTLIAIMQWLDITPTALFSKDTLQKQNPQRFKLSRSDDVAVLEENTKKSLATEEYEWAELFAEALVNKTPGNVRAVEQLGKAISMQRNKPERLRDVGKKLIELNKSNYRGYDYVAESYSQLGEWDAAATWYEEALIYADDTFRIFVLYDLLPVYEALGKVDKALDVAREILEQSDEYDKPMREKKVRHLEKLVARQQEN